MWIKQTLETGIRLGWIQLDIEGGVVPHTKKLLKLHLVIKSICFGFDLYMISLVIMY